MRELFLIAIINSLFNQLPQKEMLTSPIAKAARRERVIQVLILLGRLSLVYRIFRIVLVGGFRSVRARGLIRSFSDVYASIKSVSCHLATGLVANSPS